MRRPPVGEGVHAGALCRHLAVEAQALVYSVRGQSGRSYGAGDLAGHVQTVSQPVPHMSHFTYSSSAA